MSRRMKKFQRFWNTKVCPFINEAVDWLGIVWFFATMVGFAIALIVLFG